MEQPVENVWDYPRPPRFEPVAVVLAVVFGGREVARTRAGWRVLETSHPPTYYFPPGDVAEGVLEPAPGRSLCEWKGAARYWTVVAGAARAERAAWSYPAPTAAFGAIADHVAFYPGAMDRCRVGEMVVEPQPGDFYGGWVTENLRGPFKGGPGTMGW
jgi:uncharacterized protein (DUF427 family)